MEYVRCCVSRVPEHMEDQISEVCFRYRAEGVSQVLAFEQPALEYAAHILKQDLVDLDAYFTEVPSPEFTEALHSLCPQATVSIQTEQGTDWLHEWKKGFVPFELIKDVWIVPSWANPKPNYKRMLTMNPGMAFGTGHHATTQLAAQWVDSALRTLPNKVNTRVLDVGTGTGVLALVAAEMGVSDVWGVDNDLESIRVASENLSLNEFIRCADHPTDQTPGSGLYQKDSVPHGSHSASQHIQLSLTNLQNIEGSFDLVVANIIDGILLEMRSALWARTQRYLVLSGILSERAQVFIDQFIHGLAVRNLQSLEKDGWCAFLIERQ